MLPSLAMPASGLTQEKTTPGRVLHLFSPLASRAQSLPCAPVLRDADGAQMSNSALHDAASYLAGYLQQRLEVRAGDHVALLMAACRALPIAYFAILRCDAVVVAIHPAAPAAEIASHIQDCHARVAITAQARLEAVVPLLEAGRLRGAVVAAAQDKPGQGQHRHVHTLSGALAAGIAPLRMGPGGDALAVIACPGGLDPLASPAPALLNHQALAALAGERASRYGGPLDNLLAVQRAVAQGGRLALRPGQEPAFSIHLSGEHQP
ncbi:AMP-binding protein [Cupriavidus lacunae]|uniref:AMP-dependent synthetase/ligase domain-containing protein n=1 Tax=Cupriavidus lacunae TaxID=2666307 RepID=A0A370NI06_9BURK|nr:AMP-binding protein [Cupriavidus lacunae]RDK05215.1 hypothetical protein DN412_38295 [Cupriavidus lacunae]